MPVVYAMPADAPANTENYNLEMGALLQPASSYAALSPDQLKFAQRVGRDVQGRLPRRRSDGVGNCLNIANMTRLALLSRGVPPEAIGARLVGMGSDQHALLDVQYMDGGQQRVITWDSNSPWPLTPNEERAAYRPLASSESAASPFTGKP